MKTHESKEAERQARKEARDIARLAVRAKIEQQLIDRGYMGLALEAETGNLMLAYYKQQEIEAARQAAVVEVRKAELVSELKAQEVEASALEDILLHEETQQKLAAQKAMLDRRRASIPPRRDYTKPSVEHGDLKLKQREELRAQSPLSPTGYRKKESFIR